MANLLRIALLCLRPVCSARQQAAEQFTPAQRAEIVQILRDALKHDPSILRDAVSAMQADESDRQRATLEAARRRGSW